MSYYDWSTGLERGSVEDDLTLFRSLAEAAKQETSDEQVRHAAFLEQVRKHLQEHHHIIPCPAGGGIGGTEGLMAMGSLKPAK